MSHSHDSWLKRVAARLRHDRRTLFTMALTRYYPNEGGEGTPRSKGQEGRGGRHHPSTHAKPKHNTNLPHNPATPRHATPRHSTLQHTTPHHPTRQHTTYHIPRTTHDTVPLRTNKLHDTTLLDQNSLHKSQNKTFLDHGKIETRPCANASEKRKKKRERKETRRKTKHRQKYMKKDNEEESVCACSVHFVCSLCLNIRVCACVC